MEAVRVDFKEELEFLNVYDYALREVKNRIDMPDRRAAELAKNCLLNGGHLSNNKRKQFLELSDDEILQIEQAIQSVISDHGAPSPD